LRRFLGLTSLGNPAHYEILILDFVLKNKDNNFKFSIFYYEKVRVPLSCQDKEKKDIYITSKKLKTTTFGLRVKILNSFILFSRF
jgi:hypothetical protein